MWESIQGDGVLQGMGTGAAWFVTICLLIAGLVGCVLPILPGHLIILIGAIAYRLMLGPEGSGMAWWSFAVLVFLMAASQAFEFFSGAAGSKWFGGTRWGAIGAFVGSIIGLFFLPFGLLLGPLIGAIAGELIFAKGKTKTAVTSGVGSVVGTIAGMGVKILVGGLMIGWMMVDIFLIH